MSRMYNAVGAPGEFYPLASTYLLFVYEQDYLPLNVKSRRPRQKNLAFPVIINGLVP